MSLAIRITSLVLVFSIIGCSAIRTSPAKETVFLPKPELVTENRQRAPFNGYWVFNPNRYRDIRVSSQELYLPNIDIGNVEKHYIQNEKDEETRMKRIEESKELARYFKEKLKMILQNSPDFSEKIVNTSSKQSLNINLALTEIEPTDPGINAVGTVAGFLVPGGGLLKRFGEGSVAMEGYVSKGNSAKLLEEYKDREGQKLSAFSVKDYQRYAHIRVVLDDWASQIAELIESDPEVQVEEALRVSINPF